MQGCQQPSLHPAIPPGRCFSDARAINKQTFTREGPAGFHQLRQIAPREGPNFLVTTLRYLCTLPRKCRRSLGFRCRTTLSQSLKTSAEGKRLRSRCEEGDRTPHTYLFDPRPGTDSEPTMELPSEEGPSVTTPLLGPHGKPHDDVSTRLGGGGSLFNSSQACRKSLRAKLRNIQLSSSGGCSS
jgi:hypothetical protein